MAVRIIITVVLLLLALIWFGYCKRKKLWWEKTWWEKIIISLILPLTIGVVTSIWALSISSALKDKELRVKYVEIATVILNDPKSTTKLRTWATEVVNKYSDVPLSEDVKKEFIGGAVIGGTFKVETHRAGEGGDHQKLDK
jgi:Zn-dependent protease with chaperone function